jgi:hypothetical protein
MVTTTLCGVRAQSRSSEPTDTGTITGLVTAGGKPLAGISIALQSSALQSSQPLTPLTKQSTKRVKTDDSGRYKFTGIPAGSYQVFPWAPLYVVTDAMEFGPTGKMITLTEGETAANFDLVLVRGGVVTGRITDPEGRPVIERAIQLDRLDDQNNFSAIGFFGHEQFTTDDRGVYRVFGVPPGRYRVSVGDGTGTSMLTTGGRSFPRTYNPGVTDLNQATIIEVKEESVITGVDITLKVPPKTYAITGRVIDTGADESVPHSTVWCMSITPNGGMEGWVDMQVSGTKGEFRFDRVKAGRYKLHVGTYPGAPSTDRGYSEQVVVNVLDDNVEGVDIKIARAGSLSGAAVVEGTADQTILSSLPHQKVMVMMSNQDPTGPRSIITININQDGRFQAEGLLPGRLGFQQKQEQAGGKGLKLLRVERDGVPLPDGLDIGRGEQVTGVLLVFATGNGVIRGKIEVAGGNLPEGSSFFISYHRIGGPRPDFMPSERVDARGFFLLEGLPTGEYELQVYATARKEPPEWRYQRPTAKQTVAIANDQTVEIVMTINLGK